MGQTTDLIIWGSCVSRDTVEYLPKGTFSVRRYIARQSWCSAGHGCVDAELQKLRLPSPFQQRMFDWDLAGSALDLIEETFIEYPTAELLMDLTDERAGFFERKSDGQIITNSFEARAVGLDDALGDRWRHIRFGSLEHFLYFAQSAQQVQARLKEIGIWERTRVVAVPWAGRTRGGALTPSSFGIFASEANEIYDGLYDFLKEGGWNIREYCGLDPMADPANRWGLAPFHYEKDVYYNVAKTILPESIA